jgi:hypothetical protein
MFVYAQDFYCYDDHQVLLCQMSQGFSAAITACEKGCQWEMALDVLQGMPQATATTRGKHHALARVT